MAGGDPWAQDLGHIEENPGYVPLFNVFAPVAEIHELLPKLLFTLVWLATAGALVRLFAANPQVRGRTLLVLTYFALNPYL